MASSTQSEELTDQPTPEDILEYSRIMAGYCISRLSGRPNIEFDDLVGEGAIAILRALPKLQTEGRTQAEAEWFLKLSAKRAAWKYIYRELRCGAHIQFDPDLDRRSVAPDAESIVRLHQIFERGRLTVRQRSLISNAAEGDYPQRGSNDQASLRYARSKLRRQNI